MTRTKKKPLGYERGLDDDRYLVETCGRCGCSVRVWEADSGRHAAGCLAPGNAAPPPVPVSAPAGALEAQIADNPKLLRLSAAKLVQLDAELDAKYQARLDWARRHPSARGDDGASATPSAALLDILSDLCACRASKILVLGPAASATDHHRLGRAIEERGHARELYERTVVNDMEYRFGAADVGWDTGPRVKGVGIGSAAGRGDAAAGSAAGITADVVQAVVERVCRKRGVTAHGPAYVTLRALEEEAAALHRAGSEAEAGEVELAHAARAREIAQLLQQSQAGAAAIGQRMSGRNTVQTDMSLDAQHSRNFQITMRPATLKYAHAVALDDRSPELCFELGRALVVANRHGDAVRWLSRAVALRGGEVHARGGALQDWR